MKGGLRQCIKAGSLDRRPGWLLKFGYDAELVETLKARVPHTRREWREETKEWWVNEEYNGVLMELFGNFEALAFLQCTMFSEGDLTGGVK